MDEQAEAPSGDVDPTTGEFPQLPEGGSILFSECQERHCPAQLLVETGWWRQAGSVPTCPS